MRGRVRVEEICHRVFQVCSQAGRIYTLYMTASIYPFYLYTQHCKISGWWFGTFFHILGIIIPTDQYFLEGLKPPTRYCKDMARELWELLPCWNQRFGHPPCARLGQWWYFNATRQPHQVELLPSGNRPYLPYLPWGAWTYFIFTDVIPPIFSEACGFPSLPRWKCRRVCHPQLLPGTSTCAGSCPQKAPKEPSRSVATRRGRGGADGRFGSKG